MLLPVARHQGLTITELPDETLVYDDRRKKAHFLNRTAAFIWKRCDGATTTSQLAHLLYKEMGLPAEDALVDLAVAQLSRRHLMETPSAPNRDVGRYARRDALKKLAVGLAALPLVMTVTARGAQSQASAPVTVGLVPCTPAVCQTGLQPTKNGQPQPPCTFTANLPDGTACGSSSCCLGGGCTGSPCGGNCCSSGILCCNGSCCPNGNICCGGTTCCAAGNCVNNVCQGGNTGGGTTGR